MACQGWLKLAKINSRYSGEARIKRKVRTLLKVVRFAVISFGVERESSWEYEILERTDANIYVSPSNGPGSGQMADDSPQIRCSTSPWMR